jgi:hypothetical protein
VWSVDANSASAVPAPNAVSLAVDRDRLYLGRNDGTVARRSLAVLRASAKPVKLAKPEACEQEGGGMFGALGRLGGSDEPRGRLPDDGAYDEPDPEMPSLEGLGD